ncbi:MAG: glycoside hydrolase family 88 protein [Bacteroidaceae bacterium]|nr:glycoside hydrolase family 88 protein [Bacteroidaceae bacterium]
MKNILLSLTLSLALSPAFAQEVNDATTPLHLMKPAYKIPYGVPKKAEVKADIDRILTYLEGTTPMVVEDMTTLQPITDYKKIDANSRLKQGSFRLTSYEWGVTYSAMLAAGRITGDKRYTDYAEQRMQFLADIAPYFDKNVLKKGKTPEATVRKIVAPAALDDAGAICCAMIKASKANSSLRLQEQIDRYADFVLNKELRLPDGTFSRNRPLKNSLWLDDMFMGLPTEAFSGHYDEAVKHYFGFVRRMFVPELNLYRHGYIEGRAEQPNFFWGRANGWALLTTCELLDVLPKDHPRRPEVMEQYRKHVRGLIALQSGEGFWHQLLNREDSYLESSCTAIYAYCLAHGINEGWIEANAYGGATLLAWNAVSTEIQPNGQVTGTCVGTGMAFDPAFYYYRPVHVMAAHAYGPAIWAGAEIIRLLDTQHPKMNDSAVHFYSAEQNTDKPIFNEE